MADKNLEIKITVDDSGASKTLGELKTEAESLNTQLQNTSKTIDGKINPEFVKLASASANTQKEIKGLNLEIASGAKLHKGFIGGITSLTEKVLPGFRDSILEINAALDANPIGAVVLALGLLYEGIKTVFGFITKDQAVLEKFNEAFAGIEKVVVTLIDEFLHLGDTLAHPIDAIKKLFGAYKEGAEAAKTTEELKIATSNMNEAIARQSIVLDTLKIAVKNKTLSDKERLKDAKLALDEEDKITNEKVNNARKELEAYQLTVKGIKSLSSDQIAQQKQLEANITQLQADGIQARAKLENESNTLIENDAKEKKKAAAEAGKKQKEADKKKFEDKFKLLKAQNKTLVDNTKVGTQERVDAEKAAADSEIKFLTDNSKKLELDATELLTQTTDINNQVLTEQQTLNTKLADEAQKKKDKEDKAFEEDNKKNTAALKKKDDDQLKAIQQNIKDKKASYKDEKDYLLKNYKDLGLTEEEMQIKLLAIDDQATKTKIENAKKEADARKQLAKDVTTALTDLDNLFVALQGDNSKKTLKQRNEAAKKEFGVKKALGLVNAGINTAEAITEALPNPITVDFAALAGAAQIATIAAAKFNPESASSTPTGNTPAAPTSGSTTQQFAPPTFSPNTFFGLGKQKQNQQQTSSQQQNGPVVSVQEITSVSNKVNVIQKRSVLGN